MRRAPHCALQRLTRRLQVAALACENPTAAFQPRLCRFHRLRNGIRGRPAWNEARRNAGGRVEAFADTVRPQAKRPAELVLGHCIDHLGGDAVGREACVHRRADHAADDVMRLAEREIGFAHHQVGEIGRGRKILGDAPLHQRRVRPGRGDDEIEERETTQRLLTRLPDTAHPLAIAIDGVGEMGRFHRRRRGDIEAEQMAGLALEVFEHHRVFLLRHDARRPGYPVGELDRLELVRDHHVVVLRHTAPPQRDLSERRQDFEPEIPGRDGIECIFHEPLEAERTRQRLPIDREGRAGERACSERADIGARPGVGEAAVVAFERLRDAGEIEAVGDGLRRLEMGVARHHHVPETESSVERMLLDREKGLARIEQQVAGAQPVDRRGQVIAAAGDMHPPASLGADELDQVRFEVEVQILALRVGSTTSGPSASMRRSPVASAFPACGEISPQRASISTCAWLRSLM